jgi:hypothetical protein
MGECASLPARRPPAPRSPNSGACNIRSARELAIIDDHLAAHDHRHVFTAQHMIGSACPTLLQSI